MNSQRCVRHCCSANQLKRQQVWLLIMAALLCWTNTAKADRPPAQERSDATLMTYIHNGPESPSDHRYDFHWEILRTALERTRGKYEPYRLEAATPMTEERQVRELQTAKGALNVVFLGTTAALERTLIPIRIPVDKNLSGYFVFLIRAENQPRFNEVQSVADLRHFSFGLGEDWLDNAVFAYSGLEVRTGGDYEGLFRMLLHKRFDAFPRSGVEIGGEFDARRQAMPDLRIEQHLLLSYPWPMYFWFANNAQGKALAERAEEGMWNMIDDGTYDRIFYRFFGADIERLKLWQRRLLTIDNPNLPAHTPLDDARLWYVPAGPPPLVQ